MKIDDVIKILEKCKEMFGNLDVKMSLGYEVRNAKHAYSKKLIIKDIEKYDIVVSSLSYGDVVLIKGDDYERKR